MNRQTAMQVFYTVLVGVVVGQAPTDNIPTIAGQIGLTTLVDNIRKVNLVNSLEGPGPFTVFGPDNEAWENVRYPADRKFGPHPEFLRDVLLYHVYPNMVRSTAFTDESNIQMANGNVARVGLYPRGKATPDVITLQCAALDLDRVDFEATDGVLHVLKSVMLPPAGNMLDFIQTSIFRSLAALAKDFLQEFMLRDRAPRTFFAPNEVAFAKLPPEVLAVLFTKPRAVHDLFESHLVNGTYCRAGLTTGTLTTINGNTLQIQVSGDDFTVNGATVMQADGTVTNGVVHSIDNVLMA